MRFLLACALGGALLAGVAAAPSGPVFTLGVLRRDAIVVPFATYTGKEWKHYWPDPENSVDVPMNLRSVPNKWWGPTGPLDTWQAWAGPKPETIHVRQPDWLKTYCQKQVGLRTDYQPRSWPPGSDVQPYPKDGLAVSPPQKIDPIERLAPDSGEATAVAQLLRNAYAVQEQNAVYHAQEEGAVVAPTEAELARLPITIESLYAIGKTHRAYWVESNREYKDEANKCSAVLFGSGWLLVDSGQLVYAAFRVDMVPCNRQTLLYMLPLGSMTLPTGTYWIAQWSGWDREQYGVFEIQDKSIEQQLGVPGGGCPLQ